jgi:hypothetical protein
MQQSVAHRLRAAVKIGELPPKTECDELEVFFASVENAILRSSLTRFPSSALSIDRFDALR